MASKAEFTKQYCVRISRTALCKARTIALNPQEFDLSSSHPFAHTCPLFPLPTFPAERPLHKTKLSITHIPITTRALFQKDTSPYPQLRKAVRPYRCPPLTSPLLSPLASRLRIRIRTRTRPNRKASASRRKNACAVRDGILSAVPICEVSERAWVRIAGGRWGGR